MRTAIASLICLVTSFAVAQNRIVVAQDGSGAYKTVQAAFDAIPRNNTRPVTVFVKNGLYREKVQLDSTKNRVTLVGESRDKTILTFDDHPGKPAPGGGTFSSRSSYSFRVVADDFAAENITFRNDAGFTAGQAIGVECRGDRAVFRHCNVIGNQDILFLNSENSRQYYDDCYIEGTTDFIFGAATAWFEKCRIYSKKNSHITAASTPQDHAWGFVFNNCTLTGDTSLHQVSLGRPWRPYSKVLYMHCFFGPHIKPEGWSDWNDTHRSGTARYAEFENSGPGAAVANRVPWSKQLTRAEASEVTLKNVFGDWDPNAALKR